MPRHIPESCYLGSLPSRSAHSRGRENISERYILAQEKDERIDLLCENVSEMKYQHGHVEMYVVGKTWQRSWGNENS